MAEPLVTIICLCYNHQRFVREAVESVINQSYKKLQIIIVDDASTDGSVDEIRALTRDYSGLELLLLPVNQGNCKAFNAALGLIKGEFVVDFATDDVMMEQRIEKQVNFFSKQPKSVGVVFTDAVYIDARGKPIRNHYEYLFKKRLLRHIPVGDVYRDVLKTYFIASPTMMVRRDVIEHLNGYDESLVYEDFDFWVRSSRQFQYAFLNEQLTKIRRTGDSMSSGWYVPGDKQLHSTYLVCKKAQLLNEDEEDNQALRKRVKYELRQSVFSDNRTEAKMFFNLLTDLRGVGLWDWIFIGTNKLNLPLSWLRKLYHRVRYR